MPEPQDQPEQVPGDPAPGDDHDAGLSGDLGTVTDEEWGQTHERLRDDLAALLPTTQLTYIWAPGQPADSFPLDLPIEPDEATVPDHGHYDPDAADERFTGGGFRG
jgi:hypothetical protein